MKKYGADVWCTAYMPVYVEAESLEEAEEKIKHLLNYDENFAEEFYKNCDFDSFSTTEGVWEV